MLSSIHSFMAEVPWYVPASILLIGVVVWYTGNSRAETRIQRTGLGVVLLGLLVMMTSWFLVSDRERVAGLSRELVKAVAARDWARMEAMLHPQAAAFVFKGRGAVCNATRLSVERIDLKSASATGLTVRTDNHDGFVAAMAVYSTATAAEANTLTNWELDWEYIDGRWQVMEIRGMDGPFVRSSDLSAWIQRGR